MVFPENGTSVLTLYSYLLLLDDKRRGIMVYVITNLKFWNPAIPPEQTLIL